MSTFPSLRFFWVVISRVVSPVLLIIYAKIFEKAAIKLSNWKNRRGLLTETVSIETIADVNDVNFVEKFKKYIRERRANAFARLRYVLLFGDTDMIKPETDLTSIFGGTSATTEGQLYFGHRDHGDWDGWVNPPFTNSHLDQVTGDIPSIFYSINCQTGRYDLLQPTECFAEKNLRMKGAAPSLIAATRNSSTSLNNDLIKAMFDATFGGVLPTFPGGNESYFLKTTASAIY